MLKMNKLPSKGPQVYKATSPKVSMQSSLLQSSRQQPMTDNKRRISNQQVLQKVGAFDEHDVISIDSNDDDVEQIKDFNTAYEKLVEKFYHKEAATLLVPTEDVLNMAKNQKNKVKVNMEDRQRRIEEQRKRKEERMKLAQIEKEKKEMEECSFTPKIYARRKRYKSQFHAKPPPNFAFESARSPRELNMFDEIFDDNEDEIGPLNLEMEADPVVEGVEEKQLPCEEELPET